MKRDALGILLAADMQECKDLDVDEHKMEEMLTDAVKACKATLLSIDIHSYSPQGISGIAIIAESHLSIHVWPEYNYVAVDVFTCGGLDPYPALEVVKRDLKPKNVEIKEIKRGVKI